MTRLRVVAAVAVAAALLGACGGGGGAKQGASLSDGYVKQANALCGDWTKALEELGTNPPLADVAATARFTKKVLSVDETFTPRFKALSASGSEQKFLGPIYAGFDAINAAEAAEVNSAERGDRAGVQSFQQTVIDETNKNNARLKALRLTVCSG